MKKIIAILLMIMLVAVTACSNKQISGTPTKVTQETKTENKEEQTQTKEETEKSNEESAPEKVEEANKEETNPAEEKQPATETPAQDVEFEKVKPVVDEPIVSEDVKIGDYTSEFLSKYIEDGSYYIVQNSIIDGKVTKVEIAVSGEKASEKVGTQVKVIDGDKLFYVIHDSKAVLTSPVADSMKEGFTDFISVKTSAEAGSALQNTGEEEVQGEKFKFEEFKNADGVIAKYYYDDVTLRYVNITKADGANELIQVEKISEKIPDDMFKVPSDYIVQDISKMQ